MKNAKNGKQINLERIKFLFKGIQDYLESRYIDINARGKLFSSFDNIPFVPEKSFIESYYEETVKKLRKRSEFKILDKTINDYFGLKPSDFLPTDYYDGKLLTWLKTRKLVYKKLFQGDTNNYSNHFLNDLSTYKEQLNRCRVYYALDGILFPVTLKLRNVRTVSKEELLKLADACEYLSHYTGPGEFEPSISISRDSILAKENYGYLVSEFQYNIVDVSNTAYETLIDRISFELSILRLSCKNDFFVQNIYVIPINCFDWDINFAYHFHDYSSLKNAWDILDPLEYFECIEKISIDDLDPIFDLLHLLDVKLKKILPKEIEKSISFFNSSSELAKNYNSVPFAFLRLITSLEQILNPNGQIEQLKTNFSKRFSYLTPDNILVKWGKDIGSDIYQFRNDLVHGGKEEVILDTMTLLPESLNGIWYSDIRELVRAIILRILHIYSHISQKNEFTEFLSKNLKIDQIPTKWNNLVKIIDKVYEDPELAREANIIFKEIPTN